MNVLVPCPSCARHVRATESACPFCASALPTDLARHAVPPATRRMNRAAAFTFAATLAVTGGAISTSACGGVVDQGPDDPGGGQTMYGIARADDGGVSTNDGGGPMPMYGAARYDAGEAEDGGTIGVMYGIAYADGGEPGPPDDGGVVAAYGLPRPP